jgi:hypothetical protein
MLIYHPAFDIYNGVFRMLRLIQNMKKDTIEFDRIRVWDFYLVFPNETKNITFPTELSELKTIFKDKPNPYEDLIDAKRIFERMKPYQSAALKCLASYGFIDSKELSKNLVKRTDKVIPLELKEEINKMDIKEENLIKLVKSPINDLPLLGKSGFKDRTRLIDNKYDTV